MKTDNAIVNWSNNIVNHGSQAQYFFHKTKFVRLEKTNHAQVVYSLVLWFPNWGYITPRT